ncbi:MAG TPA: EAL domain-containing protein, partial [Myxococcota bacterium]|nr:EAL domain-containing protein [Myxococcota bacterium]
RFRAVTRIERDGRAQPLLGEAPLPPLAHAEPARGSPSASRLLALHSGERAPARLLLEVAIDRDGARTLIAELDAPRLIEQVQRELMLSQASLCVLRAREPVAGCSGPGGAQLLASFPERIARSTAGSFRWSGPGGEQLAGYARLALDSRFDAERWSVVLSEPASAILAPVERLRALFPAALLLVVIVVASAGAARVRALLGSLHALMRGARRIAGREFDAELRVESGDELQELAASLNAMSGRLAKQFSALERLIEIDRAILSATDGQGIATPILERISGLYASDYVALLLLETKNADCMTSYQVDPTRKRWTRGERPLLATQEVEQLRGRDAERPLAIGPDARGFLEPLAEAGMAQATALPLWIEQQLVGVLLLGQREVRSSELESLAFARQLADQAAAALSHVHRIEENRLLAYYDSLTGLPNRLLFMEHLRESLRRASRNGHRVAVCLLDLDQFKQVNDTLGHNAGDELLKFVAQRLTERLRSGSVARIGGDEFAFCLTNFSGVDSPARVAQGLLSEITRPYTLRNQEVFVTASVGISIYPADGQVVETVMKNADAAMYHAKRQGRNNYQFYTPSMNAMAVQRLAMESALRKAIELDQLRAFYQPVVDVQTREVVGAEALLRWVHPEFGMVSPGDFVPLAEESGLIIEIGEWMLREACAQARAWQDAGHGLFSISVNVSSRQFKDGSFLDVVRSALRDSALSPQTLTLELTESLLLDVAAVTVTLGRLRALGVKIAIDDFGTGFSSLGYLKHFPLDALKIDQVFIRNLTTDEGDSAITDAIITLARSLKLQVVAEGVETEAQLARLRAARCDAAQGFLFSEPVPADGFEKLLLEREGGA